MSMKVDQIRTMVSNVRDQSENHETKHVDKEPQGKGVGNKYGHDQGVGNKHGQDSRRDTVELGSQPTEPTQQEPTLEQEPETLEKGGGSTLNTTSIGDDGKTAELTQTEPVVTITSIEPEVAPEPLATQSPEQEEQPAPYGGTAQTSDDSTAETEVTKQTIRHQIRHNRAETQSRSRMRDFKATKNAENISKMVNVDALKRMTIGGQGGIRGLSNATSNVFMANRNQGVGGSFQAASTTATKQAASANEEDKKTDKVDSMRARLQEIRNNPDELEALTNEFLAGANEEAAVIVSDPSDALDSQGNIPPSTAVDLLNGDQGAGN